MPLIDRLNMGINAGTVHRIALLNVGDVFATAVSTGQEKLKLITWHIDAAGVITRRKDVLLDDHITRVAIIQSNGKVIAAHRNSNEFLYLTELAIDGTTGAITVEEHWGAGGINTPKISDAEIGLRSTLDGWVVAYRTTNHNLAVESWWIAPDKFMKRRHVAGAGEVSEIGAASMSDRVITAVRNGGGLLELIHWSVGADGSVTRMGDSGSQGHKVGLLAITTIANVWFVTAGINPPGGLEVASWKVQPDGNLKRFGAAIYLGPVTEVSAATLSDGSVVTAVRGPQDKLRVINWSIEADGTVKQLGDSGEHAGVASLIRILPRGSKSMITAVQDSEANLKLIPWRKA